MTLAVVIPMFNEAAGARACVSRVSACVAAVPDTELIVVDDGSTDATVAELEEALSAGSTFTLVQGGANRGYGGALRLGAQRAAEHGATWLLFMDSDLTNPPEQIAEFVREATASRDVVKACRYCPGGSTGDVPAKRMIISRAGNLVARALFGVPHRDLTNGFRAWRADQFLSLPLTERGFAIIMEEDYWIRRRHLKVAELPSRLTNRSAGLRPSSFRYTRAQIWAYLRWPLRAAGERVDETIRTVSSRSKGST